MLRALRERWTAWWTHTVPCIGGPFDGERRMMPLVWNCDCITLVADVPHEFIMLDAWDLSSRGHTVIGWYAFEGRQYRWRQMQHSPRLPA